MENGIILSSSHIHGKDFPLIDFANELRKNGISALLTNVKWPRDELVFFSNGLCDYVEKASDESQCSSDFSWNGGTFLKGNNFIIGSDTACPKSMRKNTHNILDVAEGFYFDISRELDSMKHVSVSGNNMFFNSYFPHIDILYNIGNYTKKIFTYDSPVLRDTAEKMANSCGYDVFCLPLDEAKFASVGFVEVGNKILIDKRARSTKGLLSKLGYDVFSTPAALVNTNQKFGSLRCSTTEVPLVDGKVRYIYISRANPNRKYKVDSSSNLVFC
jgi:hypothetical protein